MEEPKNSHPKSVEQLTDELIEKLAEWSQRLSNVAKEVGSQTDGATVNSFSRFYLGLLKRQVLLLSDISLLLQITDKFQLQSVFILFRCLLDDFILLLYIASKRYDEEVIITHDAKMFNEHYKTMRESRDLNHKYFEGKMPGMYNEETYEKSYSTFTSSKENEIYFDKDTGKFKTFPPTRVLVIELEEDMEGNLEKENIKISKANSHAFLIWKYLSGYVHYSTSTNKSEVVPEIRYIELVQLQESLTYCFKSIDIISEVLKTKYGIDQKISDQGLKLFEEMNLGVVKL